MSIGVQIHDVYRNLTVNRSLFNDTHFSYMIICFFTISLSTHVVYLAFETIWYTCVFRRIKQKLSLPVRDKILHHSNSSLHMTSQILPCHWPRFAYVHCILSCDWLSFLQSPPIFFVL